MNKTTNGITAAAVLFAAVFSFQLGESDKFPTLKGPYLGQKPPGLTPEVFLSGILTSNNMGAFCTIFSPAGKEFFFVYYQNDSDTPGKLSWMRQINNVWTKPEPLSFSTGEYFDGDMCLSPDGFRMFFRSWRPLPGNDRAEERSAIWFVTRTQNGWSEAKPVTAGGEVLLAGYPSCAFNGTLYFPHRAEDSLGESDIYRSRFISGAYSRPENLGPNVNSPFIEGDMFVAPDESYLIVSCVGKPESPDDLDLYISFQNSDGTWTRSQNMGDKINTREGENCPQISPDGKYFFFNRYNPKTERGAMYWMDAKIIESLRAEGQK